MCRISCCTPRVMPSYAECQTCVRACVRARSPRLMHQLQQTDRRHSIRRSHMCASARSRQTTHTHTHAWASMHAQPLDTTRCNLVLAAGSAGGAQSRFKEMLCGGCVAWPEKCNEKAIVAAGGGDAMCVCVQPRSKCHSSAGHRDRESDTFDRRPAAKTYGSPCAMPSLSLSACRRRCNWFLGQLGPNCAKC